MSHARDLTARVRQAVLWRSGSQIVAQAVAWSATFLVIRQLSPADYGLFAMTQVVLVALNLVNGYGMASALIRADRVTVREWRQLFGMLLLLNGGLGLAQFLLAPLAADYYREPQVAALLRVQSLLYLATPFLALPQAMLARRMDFRAPAQARLLGAIAGAVTALACAAAGWGVWTLVAAPFAIFYVEAIAMTRAARSLIRPSFDFSGAGQLLRFGGALTLASFFWVIQSQADVLIAGRAFDPHTLGLYTTALFLTQILATKFVPPLNEVAFAAYSRMQGDGADLGGAFLKSVRLILLVTMPAYLGLAVVAEPFVAVVLGAKWAATGAIVPILALAMPILTLQILFAPATNARGRPGIAVRTAAAGSVLLPLAFLVGVRFGAPGMAWGWLAGIAALAAVTARLSMPAIGIGAASLLRAAAPALAAATAMAAALVALGLVLPPLAPLPRLLLLVGAGAAAYLALLRIFWPRGLADTWALTTGAAVAA